MSLTLSISYSATTPARTGWEQWEHLCNTTAPPSLHGPLSEVPPLPPDRNMWSSLGDMAPSEARRTFVREVTRLMPHLLPYLEAHAAEDAEADRERERRARLQPGENGG